MVARARRQAQRLQVLGVSRYLPVCVIVITLTCPDYSPPTCTCPCTHYRTRFNQDHLSERIKQRTTQNLSSTCLPNSRLKERLPLWISFRESWDSHDVWNWKSSTSAETVVFWPETCIWSGMSCTCSVWWRIMTLRYLWITGSFFSYCMQ